jgi:hypothetical protein
MSRKVQHFLSFLLFAKVTSRSDPETFLLVPTIVAGDICRDANLDHSDVQLRGAMFKPCFQPCCSVVQPTSSEFAGLTE